MNPDSQKKHQSLDKKHHHLTLGIIYVLNVPHCKYVLSKEPTYKNWKDSMKNADY